MKCDILCDVLLYYFISNIRFEGNIPVTKSHFRYHVDGLPFAFVHDFCVDLGGLHCRMAEKLRYGIKVCAVRQGEGSEGVTGDMECDVLGNPRLAHQCP